MAPHFVLFKQASSQICNIYLNKRDTCATAPNHDVLLTPHTKHNDKKSRSQAALGGG